MGINTLLGPPPVQFFDPETQKLTASAQAFIRDVSDAGAVIEQSAASVTALQASVAAIDTQIVTLQTGQGSLNTSVGSLNSSVGTLNGSVTSQGAQLATLGSEVGTLQTQEAANNAAIFAASAVLSKGNGISGSVTIPKLTGTGANGVIAFENGIITGYQNPS